MTASQEPRFSTPPSNAYTPPRFSRRAMVGGVLASLVLPPPALASKPDIEPGRSPLEQMLEILPEQHDDTTGEFADIAFVDGDHPGWQRHDATASRLFQPGTLTRVDPDEWEALFGFTPSDVEASVVQHLPAGSLRIVKGQFTWDRIETIEKVIEGNGYEVIDTRATLPEMHRSMPPDTLQHRYPSIFGIEDGRFDTIAFLDNQMIVLASSPALVELVRAAERKRIPSMTFGPGITGIRRNEPEAVYEAAIVPGSIVPRLAGMPHPISFGVFTSYPDPATTGTLAISGMRPAWSVIATLSWQEKGHLVSDDEVSTWVDVVRTGFEHAISTRTGRPFADIMSLIDISTSHGTVKIELLPRSSIPGYYELIDMALNHDLGFLDPTSAAGT